MTQALVVLTPEELEQLVQRTISATLAARQAPEVLNREQCAELLDVNPRTLDTYVARDGLPGVRLGHAQWRFIRADVMRWLAARKAK